MGYGRRREAWGPPFCSLRCAALTKGGTPRLWFSEGNSNCRSRERVIVAEQLSVFVWSQTRQWIILQPLYPANLEPLCSKGDEQKTDLGWSKKLHGSSCDIQLLPIRVDKCGLEEPRHGLRSQGFGIVQE